MAGGAEPGLEPTYEGLKHEEINKLLTAILGLEPTYEGLKPDSKSRGRKVHQGLEPTYEGLKPAELEDYGLGEVLVWSLPTRD